MNTNLNFGTWIVAWIIILGSGIALNSFEGGQKVLYYLLWLLVILLVVAYSEEIVQILSKANIAGFNQSATQSGFNQ